MPASGTDTNVLTKPRAEILVGVISTKVQRGPNHRAEVAGKLYFHCPSLCSSTGAPKKEGSFSPACSHCGAKPTSSLSWTKKLCLALFCWKRLYFSSYNID